MALITEFTHGDSYIRLNSDGWSGTVLDATSSVADERKFTFEVDFTLRGGQYGDSWIRTTENSYGIVSVIQDKAKSVIGMSLEHMGDGWWDGRACLNVLGRGVQGQGFGLRIPAFGLKWDTGETPTALNIDDTSMNLQMYTYFSAYLQTTGLNSSTFQYVTCDPNCNPLQQFVGWVTGIFQAEITTDLPIFETDADLLAWCLDPENPDTLAKMLNYSSPVPPEEEYKEQFDFWYIKNKWGHNTRNVDSNVNQKQNYRFYPKRKGICFIKHTPTAAEPYDRILYNYSNYDAKYAAWGEDADEDFIDHPGGITTHFLTKSISFGSNDYYTKFDYRTNIPLWKDQQDADDYYNGLKDISEAENYAYISRQDDSILNPDLPGTDIDEATAMRTNGMRFSYGVRLYEITNIELANLMQEMFNPANVEDVIAGNKLFGANTMSAVSGVMYLPFADLSEICELGSLANIKIGSWEAQTAQGKRIIKNEGTIDCGSFFYNRTYLDYRDYEPYNLLFVNLPFCGCHQLTISKYLDKTVNVSYNVDVCTGGIVAKLTADDILVDIFEGTCGASRPISATDNNAYINSIVGAITGASSSASGSIEGITNAVGNVGKAANMGAAAAGGAAFGAVAVAAAAGASGVYTAYQVKNAVDNPPQMHRGSLAGNLGYYLNSKPSFLFFTKKSIRPENELETIGYPSGHGGAVGSFSGFLSCSAFKLADGFTGTDEERAEIMEIMRGGIYL